jgi:hypothetical protein
MTCAWVSLVFVLHSVQVGDGCSVAFSACSTAASGRPAEHRILTRHRRPSI